jgi:decaprenyl-phosphate phosphoribosyltransferase
MYTFIVIRTILEITRPRQWVKNFLIVLGPFAAGILSTHILMLFVGIIGFTFASIIGYVINDWLDKDFDRLHIIKRNRGFASKKLDQRHLFFIIFICILGISVCSMLLSLEFTVCVLIYLALTLSYSVWLKNWAVLELVVLSLGFVIRGVTGTVIAGILPSGWFILSIFFGNGYPRNCKIMSQLREKFWGSILPSTSDKFAQLV